MPVAYNPTIELLLIDDDLHVLAVLEDLFSGEDDVAVTAMSDSVEAINLIRRKRFDLVITDLVMPVADGLAVTRAVHEIQPEALVMIITGYASLETTLEAIHLGVYDYITKPFQIDEFRLLVSNAATRIRLQRENFELRKQVDALQREKQAWQKARAQAQDPRSENDALPTPAPRSAAADASKLSIYERMAGGHGRAALARDERFDPLRGESAAGESLKADSGLSA